MATRKRIAEQQLTAVQKRIFGTAGLIRAEKAQEDGSRLTFMGGFYGCNSFSRGRF